jgi:hypothetical protein
MKIDARKLFEYGAALRESMARRDEHTANIRKLYAQVRREFGLTNEDLELEIIKHRETVGRRSRLGGDTVYFLRLPHDGLVKIGVTQDIATRIKALTGTIKKPTELLGTIDGDAVTERTLHYQFRQHRQHGEFFSWVPISEQVRGMIARNSALLPRHLQ